MASLETCNNHFNKLKIPFNGLAFLYQYDLAVSQPKGVFVLVGYQPSKDTEQSTDAPIPVFEQRIPVADMEKCTQASWNDVWVSKPPKGETTYRLHIEWDDGKKKQIIFDDVSYQELKDGVFSELDVDEITIKEKDKTN